MLSCGDPVGTVDGLSFDGRVPPGIEEINIFSGSQVQSKPPALRLIKYRTVGIVLKPFHLGSTVRVRPSRYSRAYSPAPAVRG